MVFNIGRKGCSALSIEAHQSPKMSSGTIDLIMVAIVCLFFAVIFVMSFFLSKTAGMVPKLISGLGLILCIIQAVQALRNMKAGTRQGEDDEKDNAHEGVRWYLHLLLVALYIVCFIMFGFIVATLAYLTLVPNLLGHKKWVTNIIFAVVTTGIVYYSFVNWFYVRLPLGLLFSNFF